MTVLPNPPILCFKDNQTERWHCLAGDVLLWISWKDLYHTPMRPELAGIWAMRDGDRVTLTNQWDDLPVWFSLHYTEVQGSLVSKFMAHHGGERGPEAPMVRPNLWRPKAGDRLVWMWMGPARAERASVSGVMTVVDFFASALVAGEPAEADAETTGFRRPSLKVAASDWSVPVGIVRQMGIPRTWAPEWRLGA